jgi:acid phosphatase class B
MKFKVLRKLRIFDFDDTLVYTDAKIGVPSEGLRLNTKEFARYKDTHPDAVYDYSEFRQGKLMNPRPTAFFRTAFKRIVDKGDSDIMILTARPQVQEIKDFLSQYLDTDKLIIVGGAGEPEMKKREIAKLVDDYDSIIFFDDSVANIEAVREIGDPKIKTQIVRR